MGLFFLAGPPPNFPKTFFRPGLAPGEKMEYNLDYL